MIILMLHSCVCSSLLATPGLVTANNRQPLPCQPLPYKNSLRYFTTTLFREAHTPLEYCLFIQYLSCTPNSIA